MSIDKLQLTTRQPFGPEALDNCAAALATGSLSSVTGAFTRRLEEGFAQRYGTRHAVASSSGTAAIHSAVAALDLEPGTEVIVGPITDAGSIVPLLYQGLIPTFCDLDEHLAMTVDAIAAVSTERTGAIMIIHLFGGVSDTRAIREFADERGIKVLEDCSQAHATLLGDRYVGALGHIGMFSLQQTKHMTSGDGGVCVTDDDELARRLRLFRDKGWDRSSSATRSYPQLGLNYRITELQSAVALPQLDTLDDVVERRRAGAERLDEMLGAVEGVELWSPPPGGRASYWCYPFFVEAAHRDEIARALSARGVPVTPGYIGAPIFDCLVATHDQRTFGASGYPYTLAPEGFSYDDTEVPAARAALSRVIVFWLHEDHTDEDLATVGEAIVQAVSQTREGSGGQA